MSKIVLNDDQRKLFDAVVDKESSIFKFVLRGYAGTGKTVTLSKLITDSTYRNILVVAPTVKALSVLQGKLSTNVPGKSIDFSTMSKLIQVPAEQIEVLEQTFRLNKEDLFGTVGLKSLLEKLKIWDDDIITSRKIITKEKKSQTKYIINEELLESKLKGRFNGQSMMKPVEPVFDYKEIEDISEFLEHYDLILIDEMSMISEEDIRQVEDSLKLLIERGLNIKLVMSGDKGQLPPVDGTLNHFFANEVLEDDVVAVDLEKILRSTDEIAKIAQMIRKGVDVKQLASTVENGQVVRLDAKTFCRQNQDLLKSIDMALAFTNYDVKTFNEEIRKAKGFTGKGANVGEPLIVLENSVPNSEGLVPFANGEEFKLTKKYSSSEALEQVKSEFKLLGSSSELKSLEEEILIYVEAGAVEMIDVENILGETKTAFIPIDFEKQYGYNWKNMKEAFKNFAQLNDGDLPLLHVTYSYARTIHKSQGSEWKNTLLWLTSKNLWVMGNQSSINKRKLPYTGYTRAQATCHLVYSS